MKLRQIYVLEDEGKIYCINNGILQELNVALSDQNPDSICLAIKIKKWNKSLIKCCRSINQKRVSKDRYTDWERKMQVISTGLRWREKEVRKRQLLQSKKTEKNTNLLWSTAISRAVQQVNQKKKESKWKTWCNNISSTLDKRYLRKENATSDPAS